MKRFISILLAVMLMASMVVSANAAGTPSIGVVDLLKQAIAATGEGDDPVAEDVYVVAGNAEGASGNPDSLFNAFWDGSYAGNQMTKNADGTYSKTFTAEKAYESVGLKVVKTVNGESTWIGDANGNNIQFAVTAAGDFTVTIDPADNNKITVTGDNVQFATSFEYESVYAVGNSVKTGFLNDIDWTPGAAANKMTETADDVWEITYHKVSPDNGMQVKFAIDGTWDRNFGIAKTDAPEVKSGEAFAATWDGANIALPLTADSDDCDITLKLDLSNFDLATTTGAKITITISEPTEPSTEQSTGEPSSEEPTGEPATAEPTGEPATGEPATEPVTDAPETQAPETETPTDEPAVVGASTYYLVGSFNDWQTDEAYILTKNAEAEGEYFISGVELKKDYTFKIVETNGSILGFEPVWYPSGFDNDYTVTADGTYDIYFRPNYDGGEDWYYNCIYAADVTPEPETEAVTDAPETEAVTDAPETEAVTDAPVTEAVTDAPAPELKAYVVGNFTDWAIDDAYQMAPNDQIEDTEFFLNLDLNADAQFKCVIQIEGENFWFPEGMGNNYGENGEIPAAGNYNIYFRPNYDGGDDWFYNCIYVVAPEEPASEPASDEPGTEAPTGDEPASEPASEAGEDTYVVAGNAEGASGNPDSLFNAFWDGSYTGNQMTKNADGTYSKTFTAEKAYESVGLKVVKTVNGESTWIGDANGNNIQFAVTAAGDFTVTIDPADNNKITVTGDNVQFATSFEYEAVYAVGNSVKTGFLNDIDWTPNAASNKMTEIEENVWEITYQNVSPDNGMQVKFAIDGTWDRNFGTAKEDAPAVVSGEAFDAVWDGGNIALPLTDASDDCDITLKLDLSNFDLATTTGAKITITISEPTEPSTEEPTGEPSSEEPTGEPSSEEPTGEPATDEPIAGAPTYYVVGSFTDWEIDEAYALTANPEAEGEFMLSGVELKANDEFKVKSFTASIQGGDPKWYPDGQDNNYVVAVDGTYDIYFRPDGQGGDDWFYGFIYAAIPTEPGSEPATDEPTVEPTEPPIIGAPEYYLIGEMTNWEVDEAYKLTENTEAEGEYFISGVLLFPTSMFKVVSFNGSIQGGAMTWYPDGTGNAYGENGEIEAYGNYDIYFRPDGQGGDDWFYGVIYATMSEVQPTAPEQPTDEPASEEPTGEQPTNAPAEGKSFYLIGNITDPVTGNRLDFDAPQADTSLLSNLKLQPVEGEEGLYKYENIVLRTDDSFKVVKTGKKGDAVSEWYPDGWDNNRTVPEDGIYTVWFRPAGDGTAEDGWEYIYYVGDGSGDDQNHAATRGGYMYKIEKTGEAPVEPGDEFVLGDLDGDGVTTIFDVTYIQKWLAGMPGYKHDLTPEQIKAGDVDGDGEVTMIDATYIQRYLAGIKDLDTLFWAEQS